MAAFGSGPWSVIAIWQRTSTFGTTIPCLRARSSPEHPASFVTGRPRRAIFSSGHAALISMTRTSLATSASPEAAAQRLAVSAGIRSEEHTSELQSLMRISYAVFCLKKKKKQKSIKQKHNRKITHNEDIDRNKR